MDMTHISGQKEKPRIGVYAVLQPITNGPRGKGVTEIIQSGMPVFGITCVNNTAYDSKSILESTPIQRLSTGSQKKERLKSGSCDDFFDLATIF